jgi:hypothetical protein
MVERAQKVLKTYTSGKIQMVYPEAAWELYQARKDEAIVTGRDLSEKVWWYQRSDSLPGGKKIPREFYDIKGCIAWPSMDYRSGARVDGFGAIVGVIRQPQKVPPDLASFIILDEIVDGDPARLLIRCAEMRKQWGLGLRHDLLTAFTGDPIGHETTLNIINEILPEYIAVVEPVDNQVVKKYDIYARCILRMLETNPQRLYFGGKPLFKEAIRSMHIDDPAVTAVGGLLHTMLATTSWMDTFDTDGAFLMNEEWGIKYAG